MQSQDFSSSIDPPDQLPKHWIEIASCDRWQIFHRLQALEIPCQCRAHRPLYVDPVTAGAVIQLWSVIKQTSASRQELAQWLEHCWYLPSL